MKFETTITYKVQFHDLDQSELQHLALVEMETASCNDVFFAHRKDLTSVNSYAKAVKLIGNDYQFNHRAKDYEERVWPLNGIRRYRLYTEEALGIYEKGQIHDSEGDLLVKDLLSQKEFDPDRILWLNPSSFQFHRVGEALPVPHGFHHTFDLPYCSTCWTSQEKRDEHLRNHVWVTEAEPHPNYPKNSTWFVRVPDEVFLERWWESNRIGYSLSYPCEGCDLFGLAQFVRKEPVYDVEYGEYDY